MWRVISLFLVVGCGGEEGPWRASEREVAACRQFLAATCEAAARCMPSISATIDGGLDACVATRLEGCTKRFLPGSNVEARDLEQCATTTAAATCDVAIRALTGQADLCPRVPGDRLLGEPCDVEDQCESTYCDHATLTACGTCVAAPAVADPCVDDALCGPGKACVRGACVALHERGDACGSTAFCFADSQCSVAKTCDATIALGAACDPFRALNPCGLGNFCNEQTFICEAVRTGSTTTCGRTADGALQQCAWGLACKLTNGAGSCVPAGQIGESCAGAYQSPPCAAGLVCENSVCVAFQSPEAALLCE